ncbi:MAG: hypothetical protein SGPRY_006591, partial [Prymnesium sp.]
TFLANSEARPSSGSVAYSSRKLSKDLEELPFTGVRVSSEVLFPNNAAMVLVRDDHALLRGLVSRRGTGDLKRLSQLSGESGLRTGALICEE